jgi:16S rRNA (guanine527-N7)-methyltransferase
MLREWAPKVDLIGPGAVGELFQRHYAEGLAPLPWLPSGPFRLLDLGSGAGFPGFVLAAARPDATVFLVEPRAKKRAFLQAAARRAGLEIRCLDARVSRSTTDELPAQIDIVTVRALRLDPDSYAALADRLAPAARALFWSGSSPIDLPSVFEPARVLHLASSRGRYLREYRLKEGGQ